MSENTIQDDKPQRGPRNKRNNNNNNNNNNAIDKRREEVRRKEQELVQKMEKYDQAINQFNAEHRGQNQEKYNTRPKPKHPTMYDVARSASRLDPDIPASQFGRVYTDKFGTGALSRNAESLSADFASLKKQLQKLQKNYDKGPLGNAGIGISGETGSTIRMFVDPDDNPAVPVPGRNPESLLRGRQVARTSLVLEDGKAIVITTPFGRFQTYVSRGYNDAAGYPASEDYTWEDGLWDGWHYRQVFNAAGTVQTFTLRGSNTSANAGKGRIWYEQGGHVDGSVWCGANYNAGAFGASNNILLTFSEKMVGQNLKVTATAFDAVGGAVISGPTSQTKQITSVACLIGGDNTYADEYPFNFLLYQPTAAHTSLTYKVTIEVVAGAQATIGQVFYWNLSEVSTNTAGIQHVKWTGSNTNKTFDAMSLPTLISLLQGGLADHGAFLAMSALLTNDSSTLNNSGFIQACSLATGVLGPNNQSIEDYVSARTQWNYMGRLEKGAYQIYVPNVHELMSNQDIDLNPFCVSPEQQTYNMVTLVDNSVTVNGGGDLPKKLQCHLVTAAVFSSSKIDNFIPQVSFAKDHTYELVLGYLRHYYRPCCNPTHKDSIFSWLKNSFSGACKQLQNVATHITPEFIDGTAKVIKTVAPLIAELGTVALAL